MYEEIVKPGSMCYCGAFVNKEISRIKTKYFVLKDRFVPLTETRKSTVLKPFYSICNTSYIEYANSIANFIKLNFVWTLS